MSLRVYNSLGKAKQDFTSLEKKKVRMYVCGPTVYDYMHVGNFRGAVFFNLVRHWLEHHGYKVTYAYNYTDVDDKIIKRAQVEGVSVSQITQRYIEAFINDLNSLKVSPHDLNPKVTENMPIIITMIGKLIEKEKAYVVKGEVIYAVRKFSAYGRLSGRNPDQLAAGHRVESNPHKEDPLDFILWKPSKEGEPSWDSPWGEGRPGWHIECSSMIVKLLGESIDIHGGGSDLIFPHHENEIAQAEGVTGKPFVRYWMHNAFVDFGKAKMSKSLGNVVLACDFIKQYSAECLKFMMLSVHYRSLLKLDKDQISQSMSALARIYSALAHADEIVKSSISTAEKDLKLEGAFDALHADAVKAMDDDFNTPQVFAKFFDAVRLFNTACPRTRAVTPLMKGQAKRLTSFIRFWGEKLSLFGEPARDFLIQMDDLILSERGLQRLEVEDLITQRTHARQSQDYEKADQIRNRLATWGIDVQDTPGGTYWEAQKS